jgi:hypothetical protein
MKDLSGHFLVFVKQKCENGEASRSTLNALESDVEIIRNQRFVGITVPTYRELGWYYSLAISRKTHRIQQSVHVQRHVHDPASPSSHEYYYYTCSDKRVSGIAFFHVYFLAD